EQGLLQLPEVDDVRNFLTISPPLGDLRAQLESVFERQGVAIHGLRVTVSEGVVTLKGRAEGWFDRDAAERLTWELPDVKAVANRIVLSEGAVEPDTDEELPA
ncbi:MAG: BON domain-containing protein, partial [Alphaproteobacteria bacterium]|nr:BON domain-containing protein [Alphaproteobacteria bacterium]